MSETPVISSLLMDRSEPLGNSVDDTGRRALHVKTQGGNVTARFQGLSIGGRITMVELSDSEWRQLPSAALVNRNSLLMQNISTKTILWNYSASALASEGFQILSGGFKEVAITDAIHVYARVAGAGSGLATVVVEELA